MQRTPLLITKPPLRIGWHVSQKQTVSYILKIPETSISVHLNLLQTSLQILSALLPLFLRLLMWRHLRKLLLPSKVMLHMKSSTVAVAMAPYPQASICIVLRGSDLPLKSMSKWIRSQMLCISSFKVCMPRKNYVPSLTMTCWGIFFSA